jgi:(p)ppGpp synthase/HD superfamily hydrolase
MKPPPHIDPERRFEVTGNRNPNCRRQVADAYGRIVEDSLFPFFDSQQNDELFADLRENLRKETPMRGLPEGYGSESIEDRLRALSETRIILPIDNIEVHADTHNKTIENYIRLALLTAGDEDTAMVHLAVILSKIDNEAIDPLFASQLLLLWAPFADIIGQSHLKKELENIAFKLKCPDEYEKIDFELDQLLGVNTEQEREIQLAREAESLEIFLNTEFSDRDIDVSVTARLKSHYSIWQKQYAQQCLGQPISDTIYDYLGFRIVVSPLIDDAWSARSACLEVEAEIGKLFSSTWRTDYSEPRLQSSYKGIHNVYLMPEGMFNPGATAEFQVRTKKEHDSLVEVEQQYSHYSAMKPVPGKRYNPHIKRSRHHIYDWRARAKARYADAKELNRESLLGSEDALLFFDRNSNLYLAKAGETVLDGMFRIHSDKVFRLKSVQKGTGDRDKSQGDLRPANLRELLVHGDRLVAVYDQKGKEQPHGAWKQIVTWDRARNRIDKKLKEKDAQIYINKGEEVAKHAIEQERIGVNHFNQLDGGDWQALCQRYGLTVSGDTLSARDILLRDIGYGNQGTGKLVAYVTSKARALRDAVVVEPVVDEIPQGVELSIAIAGITATRAKCCTNIVFTDGLAYAIASRRSGSRIMHLHGRECSHMAGLVAESDPRLIPVIV